MRTNTKRWGPLLAAGLAMGAGLVAVPVSGVQAQVPAQVQAVVVPDLYWVRPAGASGVPGASTRVEVHALDGATTYTTWAMHAPSSATGADNAQWKFVVGDANADDVPDLYALNVKANSSRNTNIHVFDGRTRYTTTLVNQVLPDIGAAFDMARYRFFAADLDADGRDDLYAVDASGGRTAVHVFDAGDRFESFLAHRLLPGIGQVDLNRWQFAGGDVDGDHRADVYMIDGGDAVNKTTAVHITSAKGGYARSETNRVLPGFLNAPYQRFRFSVADFDGDGKSDVYGIDSQSGNGTNTAVHIITAGSGFTAGIHRPTAMGAFNLAQDPILTAWAPTAAVTHPTTIRKKIAKLANDEVGARESACDRYHPSCNEGALAWCAMFATWTWQNAGVAGVPRNTFVARALGKWGKDRGLFHSTPQVGDWAIYGPPDGKRGGHVDVVVAVHSATEIVVVGGNVSDRVTKRTINPQTARMGEDNVLISGYVSPPGA